MNFKSFRNSFSARPFFYLVSCFLFPILSGFCLILATFKFLTNLYLKIRYGSFYGGMLSAGDAIWAIEDVSKTIINTLVFVEEDNVDVETFVRATRNEIFRKFCQHLNDFPKLGCVRRRCMGYSYLVKNQIDVTQCVSIFNVRSNKEILLREDIDTILSAYCNRQLPNENSALWEIIIFSKPVEWTEKKNKFVGLFRFSHTVGDGLALASVLSIIFGNRKTVILDHFKHKWGHASAGRENEAKHKLFINKLKNVLYMADAMLMIPSVILHQSFFRKSDNNTLHGPLLSGEKILVYSIEEKTRLVSIVKSMKNRIKNISFSDIVLTAISKSLHSHFSKVGRYSLKFVIFLIRI